MISSSKGNKKGREENFFLLKKRLNYYPIKKEEGFERINKAKNCCSFNISPEWEKRNKESAGVERKKFHLSTVKIKLNKQRAGKGKRFKKEESKRAAIIPSIFPSRKRERSGKAATTDRINREVFANPKKKMLPSPFSSRST